MAQLADKMPTIRIKKSELKKWGSLWLSDVVPETAEEKAKRQKKEKEPKDKKEKKTNWFTKKQAVNFASFIDEAVAKSTAAMLGGIPVIKSGGKSLRPAQADCVEWGAVRIVGGIRPQNFDVAYRPDGPRIVFDSKTLNDLKSVGKNWQNMINDLATEAATAHTRFPYAVVGLMVLVPRPALGEKQEADIIRTLERLGCRKDVLDQHHLAEVLSLVIWDPETGEIDTEIPPADSILRVEKFAHRLYPHYVERYKGLPPHDVSTDDDVEGEDEESDDT